MQVSPCLKISTAKAKFPKNMMTSIGETESSKNEYDCLKCGEGFRDFPGVIFHDCPKKETKRRRLLTMFEIFELLHVKKSSEADQVENGFAFITSKMLSPSCKLSKEDYSWSLNKQKEMKLSARERYLKIRHRKRCIKPQSCTRHKKSLFAKLSDDVGTGYCMSRQDNHTFYIDLHEDHSKEGTKEDFSELLSSGFHPERFFEFHKVPKSYFSNDSMNLKAVNVSDKLPELDGKEKNAHLQIEWGKLRYAKSLTFISPEIPLGSNASEEDPKRDFFLNRKQK